MYHRHKEKNKEEASMLEGLLGMHSTQSTKPDSRTRANHVKNHSLEERCNGCVFCDIVQGKIESYPVYVNEDYLAILSNKHIKVGKRVVPVVVVMSKKHYGSDISKIPKHVWNGLQDAAYRIAKKLSERKGVKRVCVVYEGFAVDHAHVKLFVVPKGVNYRGEINKRRKYTADYTSRRMKGRQKRLQKSLKID